MNKMTVEYVKQVKSSIKSPRCIKKDKNDFLDCLAESVEDFIAENSDCTKEDIKQYFGDPKIVAKDFLDSADANILKQYFISRKRWKILIVMLLLVFLIIAAFVLYITLTSELRFVDERIF